MDVVCASQTRMTAQEICDKVLKRAPEINAATVYRNLSFLSEHDLLRTVLSHGTKQYVLGGPTVHHHHLACKQCGRELEVPHDLTNSLFERIQQAYGFEIDEPHLLLHGTCADCGSR